MVIKQKSKLDGWTVFWKILLLIWLIIGLALLIFEVSWYFKIQNVEGASPEQVLANVFVIMILGSIFALGLIGIFFYVLISLVVWLIVWLGRRNKPRKRKR